MPIVSAQFRLLQSVETARKTGYVWLHPNRRAGGGAKWGRKTPEREGGKSARDTRILQTSSGGRHGEQVYDGGSDAVAHQRDR